MNNTFVNYLQDNRINVYCLEPQNNCEIFIFNKNNNLIYKENVNFNENIVYWFRPDDKTYFLGYKIEIYKNNELIYANLNYGYPEHGRGGFIPAVNYLKQNNIQNPVIVEIGTQRVFDNTGDGCSTTFFSWFINTYGGSFYSIDINSEYIENGKKELENKGLLNDNIHLKCEDGIKYLENFYKENKKIDLLYLDAWDYNGTDEDKLYSQKNHLECYYKSKNYLHDKSLILIDDILDNHTYEGKGKQLIPNLLDNGYSFLMNDYQVLLTKISTPIIYVFVVTYNEEDILPFFLDYYLNFIKADKVFVIDGGSTDNSRFIVEGFERAEFIVDKTDHTDDKYLLEIRNNFWKKYKDECDWVIIADADEFIYNPNLKDLLIKYQKESVTIPLVNGYDMISINYPQFNNGTYIHQLVNKGIRDSIFLDKKSIFRTCVDINYDLGCHSCNPVGEISYSKTSEIKLLHYKWLSYDKFTKKCKKSHLRLSDWNLQTGCGYHLKNFSEISYYDYVNRYNSSIDVI